MHRRATSRPHGNPRWLIAAGATLAALVVVGCTEPVSGSATPSGDGIEDHQARQFDEAYEQVEASIVNIQDITATVYWHGDFDGRTSQREVDIVYYADQESSDDTPPAFFTQSRTEAGSGDNLDHLHPSGADRDFILLGEIYADLAPTDWVAVPTAMTEVINVCMITGWATICAMEEAITTTHERHRENVHKQYEEQPDGTVELTTGASVEYILERRVFGDGGFELLDEADADLLDSFIPVTVVLSPDGHLLEFSINGKAEGADQTFEVDVGFEVTGESSVEDFPPTPGAFDVTDLEDEDEVQDFWESIIEIDENR